MTRPAAHRGSPHGRHDSDIELVLATSQSHRDTTTLRVIEVATTRVNTLIHAIVANAQTEDA